MKIKYINLILVVFAIKTIELRYPKTYFFWDFRDSKWHNIYIFLNKENPKKEKKKKPKWSGQF